MLASSSSGGHRFFLGETCREVYMCRRRGKAKNVTGRVKTRL